jgi:hypothetical protein
MSFRATPIAPFILFFIAKILREKENTIPMVSLTLLLANYLDILCSRFAICGELLRLSKSS